MRKSNQPKRQYLDIEAIAAFMRIGGVKCNVKRRANGDKLSYVFEVLTADNQLIEPMVPLEVYNRDVTSISVADIEAACAMSNVTLPTFMVQNCGRMRPFTELIMSYVREMKKSCDSQSMIYSLISEHNRYNDVGKIMIGKTEDSFGPKGTPIVNVYLVFTPTQQEKEQLNTKDDHIPIGKVVCMGRSYSLSCPTTRYYEAIIRDAPPVIASHIMSKHMMFL